MNVKNILACLLAGTGIFGAIIAADWREQGLQTLDPLPYSQIEEDSPEWDCATMGNRICGPDVELCDQVTHYYDVENDRIIPTTRGALGLPCS